MSVVRGYSYLGQLSNETKEVNPFLNRSAGVRRSCLDQLKTVLVGITLLPIRVLLTIVNIIVLAIFSRLAIIGLGAADIHPLTGEPLSTWRQALFYPVRFCARVQLLLLGFWCIRIRGTCASRDDAPIIVANHISGLVEGLFFMRFAKLAEQEYVNNPAMGPVMIASSCIFVDRSDPQSRESAKKALLRRATDTRWPQTLVFPEGTTTNGTAVVQFKQGAFAPGCPVQPVLFRYNGSYDASFTFPLTSGGYLLGLMLQCANYMEVEYLPVYVPNAEETRNPELYAVHVQRKMAAALGVPTTKHAAEDVALACAAQTLALPPEAATVEWQALSENLTGLHVKTAIEVLKQFRSLDPSGDGRIDFKTFKDAMRQQLLKTDSSSELAAEETDVLTREPRPPLSDDELQGIFNLMDLSGDGYVDFREYLCGVAVLNGYGQQDEQASYKFVFDSFAGDQSEFTKEQLDVLICRCLPGLTREQLDKLFEDADRDKNGYVSRDEFITFAMRHKEDIGFKAQELLRGLPMTMTKNLNKIQ